MVGDKDIIVQYSIKKQKHTTLYLRRPCDVVVPSNLGLEFFDLCNTCLKLFEYINKYIYISDILGVSPEIYLIITICACSLSAPVLRIEHKT
jgi:hypothetical protein